MITEIKPDMVEKWAEWLDNQPKNTELDDNQMRTFLTVSLHESELERNEIIRKELIDGEPCMEKMFYNRVKSCHTYTVTNAVALAIGVIAHNPGEVTMYANYLQYKAKKMNKGLIRMEDLGMHIIPYGVFSRDTLREAWDRQKCSRELGSDNMLDHYKAQESIEIKPNWMCPACAELRDKYLNK